MNIQDQFPLEMVGWISLLSQGLSRVFSNTTVQKASSLLCSAIFIVQLSHPYIITGKTIIFSRWTFVAKVLTKRGPLEKGMVNHFSILALRTPGTVWKDPLTGEKIILKKFSHCCEGSEPHVMLPSLGIWQRDWESPGTMALRTRGIWL